MLGAVSLDYSPQAGPTKFLVGTEQGLVIAGNRKAKSAADRIGTSYKGPGPLTQQSLFAVDLIAWKGYLLFFAVQSSFACFVQKPSVGARVVLRVCELLR